MTLVEFLPQQVFGFFFIMARVGIIFFLLPGVGEKFVPQRSRLALAAMCCFVLLPIVTPPKIPDSPAVLFLLLAQETLIGLFLGLSARMVLLALETAGTIIGMQIGMANAFVMDPSFAQQAGIMGVFLSITGISILFATDMHHYAIMAMVDSYNVFQDIVWEDMAHAIARLVGDTFLLSVKLAAPFLIVGVVFNVGMGLLSRLMPQLQIFFLAMPVQIVLGLFMLVLIIGTMMTLFLGDYQNVWQGTSW